MKITITGASGLIGQALVRRLGEAGHSIHTLGRSARVGLPPSSAFSIWDPAKCPPPADSMETGAVIHLAGETVAQRWTDEVKRRIRSSRVDGTNRLVDGILASASRPSVFVCASAIGYYGDRGEELLAEDAKPGSDFLSSVCVEWERAARRAAAEGIRVVCIRIGVVLSARGGALDQMLLPFRLGLGGPLGSGEQWMSWIHVDDLVSMFCRAVDDPTVTGVWNGVAPNPVRNSDFARQLGRALDRPAILRTPKFAVRLVFGEMADILFHSQRVTPKAAADHGFEFRQPEVFAALKDVLSRA